MTRHYKLRSWIGRNLHHVLLVLATFFNPLGFDALFALVMRWTGSFWVTDLIFYLASALFFGLYFLVTRGKRRR